MSYQISVYRLHHVVGTGLSSKQPSPLLINTTKMCIALSGRVAFCNCTQHLPDNTIVRLCEAALVNRRTPCQMVSFPSMDVPVTESVSPRCACAGHIIICIKPAASRRSPEGRRDVYHLKHIHAKLYAQQAEALQSPKSGLPSSTSRKDDTRPRVLKKKATSLDAVVNQQNLAETFNSFVMVEREDGSEQFDEEGASLSSPRIYDCYPQSTGGQSLVDAGKDFAAALGRLFFRK